MSIVKRQARRYAYKMRYKYKQDPFAFLVLWVLFFSAVFLVFAFRGVIAATFVKKIDIDRSISQVESTEKFKETVPVDDNSEVTFSGDTYTVEGGDTLYGIGLKLDLDYKEIAELNSIDPPYSLSVGQELKLP